MIDDATKSIVATRAGAGIFAAFVDTRLVLTALRAAHALGSTIRRSTHIVGHTRADRVAVESTTIAVETARRGLTWIFWHNGIGI